MAGRPKRKALLAAGKLPDTPAFAEARERAALKKAGKPVYAWSQEMREKCLALVMRTGDMRSVERKFGVPKGTALRWVREALEETGDGLLDLRTAVRAHAVAGVWSGINRLLTKLHAKLDDEDLDLADEDLLKGIEQLARAADNLGSVERFMTLRLESTADARRKEATELEAFEKARGMLPNDDRPQFALPPAQTAPQGVEEGSDAS